MPQLGGKQYSAGGLESEEDYLQSREAAFSNWAGGEDNDHNDNDNDDNNDNDNVNNNDNYNDDNTGQEVRSRRAALKLLVANKAPPEKLREMMACLKHEGWESSEDLPQGWTFKRIYDHQVNNNDATSLNIYISSGYVHHWLWERTDEQH